MSYFQRLFVGTDRTFATIEVDAVLLEQYDLSSTITDHPVDRGASVSDNIINNPRVYTIEAVVTDTPMGLLAALQTIGDNARAALGVLSSAILGGEAEAPATARSVAAFESLLALHEGRVVIDVQTGMGLWTDLAIQSIRVAVDEKTANHLRFTAVLRHVRRVSLQLLGEVTTLEPGRVAESGAPVRREGFKQVIEDVSTSVQNAAARLFG